MLEAVCQLVTVPHHLSIFGLLSTQMCFEFQNDVENLEKYGILWLRISNFSAGCTRGFVSQWKPTEGTSLFYNTDILVLSIIAAADKFILVNTLIFSPLPPCLRSEKLDHVKITLP
ncbi:hypothetical protein Y032_0006g3024 [Ancylostoma ceylanicum]|uniref:Uncharacterized protein n=1 Tax=Ancylostoma ceylanicum TaxID=53326 RepID=A0A016VS28_9BILA|nr:hypothetical protein Y032_0006g3024 [Ancylostoma ceylanicum]